MSSGTDLYSLGKKVGEGWCPEIWAAGQVVWSGQYLYPTQREAEEAGDDTIAKALKVLFSAHEVVGKNGQRR